MKKSIILLAFILFWLAGLPAGNERPLTIFTDPVIGLNTQAKSVSDNGAIHFPFRQSRDLLQVRSGGHLVGFQPDRVFIAGTGYALIEKFMETQGVAPVRVAGEKDRVEYRELWKGITVAYEAPQGAIAESTFVAKPFADVSRIQIRYNTALQLQEDGSLRLRPPHPQGVLHSIASAGLARD